MPAFVRTSKDEARWSKAKEAAKKSKKKDESSFSDQDWALVNHIYHQMGKAEELGKSIKELFKSSAESGNLEELKEFLEKARRRMSDEPADDEPEYAETAEGEAYDPSELTEFDPESEDDASKWLAENDPEAESEEPGEDDYGYSEYSPEDDEEAHQRVDEPTSAPAAEAKPVEGREEEASRPSGVEAKEQEVKGESRFPQPSKEEIAEMRQYTRPWEQRAREQTRLEAEAHKNPVLHHEGRLVEARQAGHKSRQEAYDAFQASPEYQNADPISQMEMDANFDKDWHEKNPEYLQNAMKLHEAAHEKGRKAKDIHAAAKDEQIKHVLSGGMQAESPMSAEEASQHAGGEKDEEGTMAPMVHDPATSFARGNKDFIRQYAEDYAKKAKKPTSVEEMHDYDEGSRADVHRVLGEHPSLKDPHKKAKMDAFFAKYHPLIAANAHKVLNKLGFDPKRGDVDFGLLHEAGMHGLMQAINDYDHEHPSKASFSTHASNKIRGLMQTALKQQDQIPAELRTAQKQFKQASMPKDITASLKKPLHPTHADRMKRISTARKVSGPTESVKDFMARGGKITKIPSSGGGSQ